jgi:hypothetical protein
MSGVTRRWILVPMCCLTAVLTVAVWLRADAPPDHGPATTGTAGGYDRKKWGEYWAFKPVKRPELPATSNDAWARNPIDRLVLAKLDEEHLRPAAEANKPTLIRRATFDLTGLPPTPQEVRAFLADKSPVAYEKLIDRLLASPHYGEHWGRHWLDVARYVQGRISFLGIKNTLGDQAYRDYVVRSFNEDKPYDRFVTEQLAGDLLPASEDKQREFDQVIAPAFLSIGPWFDQCTDPNRLKLEMVDDMINVTGQGLLGLTVSCARCHDHKFDPIPTGDYYALAGIFGSTKIVGDFSEYWRDGRQRLLRPLAMPDQVAANDVILKQIAAAKTGRWEFLSERHSSLLNKWQADEPRYRDAAAKIPAKFIHRWAAEDFSGEHNLRIAQLNLDGRSVDVIESLMPGQQYVVYKVQAPEDGKYRLEALYCTDEGTPVNVMVNGSSVQADAFSATTGGWDLIYQQWTNVCTTELRKGLNFFRMETKAGSFPRLDRFRLVQVDDAVEQMARELGVKENLDPIVLRAFVNDPQQPWPTVGGIVPYLSPADQGRVGEMDQAIAGLAAKVKPYQTVVSVTDQGRPCDMPVHLKGDVYVVSKEAVPRGVPRLLSDVLPGPLILQGSSGRLELAKWITDARNPLTARVMVNRLWGWHFGRGIVGTPNNFGSLGERPTHPELLDWLADELVKDGWSVKHVQRLILTSSTYRMVSRATDASKKDDPEDKYLSHFPARRLEAEALYDAMASTTNIIVRQDSGKPLDVEKDKNRAMYVLSSNRSPKGLGGEVRKMFELFDYDASGVPIAQRPRSTTPAQSLFWLNSPLVKYFAGRFAERLIKMDKLDDVKRVEMAYLLALGRSPTKAESADSLEYLRACTEGEKMQREEAWASFCQALYGAAEFRFMD